MKIFSKNPNNISYADKTHSPAFKGGINKVTDSVTGAVAVARRASCPHSNFQILIITCFLLHKRRRLN